LVLERLASLLVFWLLLLVSVPVHIVLSYPLFSALSGALFSIPVLVFWSLDHTCRGAYVGGLGVGRLSTDRMQ
jgi:hypothetical protein